MQRALVCADKHVAAAAEERPDFLRAVVVVDAKHLAGGGRLRADRATAILRSEEFLEFLRCDPVARLAVCGADLLRVGCAPCGLSVTELRTVFAVPFAR